MSGAQSAGEKLGKAAAKKAVKIAKNKNIIKKIRRKAAADEEQQQQQLITPPTKLSKIDINCLIEGSGIVKE